MVDCGDGVNIGFNLIPFIALEGDNEEVVDDERELVKRFVVKLIVVAAESGDDEGVRVVVDDEVLVSIGVVVNRDERDESNLILLVELKGDNEEVADIELVNK